MKSIKKASLVALVSLMTVGTFTPHVGATSSGSQAPMQTSDQTENNLDEDLIEAVDHYIDYEDGRFRINDQQNLKAELSTADYDQVIDKLEETNGLLNVVTQEELDEAIIEDDVVSFVDQTTESDFSTNEVEAMANRNGIDILWWGYRVYLSDDLTRTTAQLVAAGAGGAAIAAKWIPVFTAPTALIKAITGTLVLVGGGVSGTLLAVNDGQGVYIRFTGILPANVIFTGVHPQ